MLKDVMLSFVLLNVVVPAEGEGKMDWGEEERRERNIQRELKVREKSKRIWGLRTNIRGEREQGN